MANSAGRNTPRALASFPPLPGTLAPLESEIEPFAPGEKLPHADNCPPPPGTPPALPGLAEQVDDFGWILSQAIRDFRSHIEEVFNDHYQAMKRTDDMHKLTMAKLEAENTQLRDHLDIDRAGPSLLQNIHFQGSMHTVAQKKDEAPKGQEAQIWHEINGVHVTNGKKDGKLPRAVFAKDKDAEPGISRIKRGPDIVPQAGGGNWETFIAWVPAGAALQCPQPWKPLPTEAFHPVELEPDLAPDAEEDEWDLKKWTVLEIWKTDKEELSHLRDKVRQYNSVVPTRGGTKVLTGNSNALMDNVDALELVDQSRRWFMFHPHSGTRVSWDLASLLLVMYDMVMIPMAFFDLPDNLFVDLMNWATRAFWTLDIGMSLSTGIVMPNGTITFDFGFIVRRYLTTWFVLDCFIVGTDWVEFIISQAQGTDSGGIGRIARVFRVVRCVRLLRLVRMQSVLQAITERIQSDNLTFVLNVLKLAIFLVSFSHIAACIWWGIGKRDGSTWSTSWKRDGVSIESQYLISLHWTLSQFSGGMDELRPAGPIERFYNVMLWIIAFMGAAIVASILTSSLVQAHIIGGSQARQLSTLRKYLNQNSISKNLQLRVQRSAKHAISGDLSPDAVDLLSVVSEQLRLEMHFELYSELFRCHPFFEQCIQACAQVMRRICHQATSTLLLDAGDILFSKGEAPSEPKMYFVFRGTLEYTSHSTVEPLLLYERQWIAEPVLWLQWIHRGTLKASSAIKVAKLDARKFQDIMERFKEVFPAGFSPKVYAHDYAEYVNSLPNVDQVNDLSGLHSF